MLEREFKAYIEQICSLTFGFVPKTEVNFPTDGTVQVILDGSPVERSSLMGKDARNFQALKMLLRIFARKRNLFSYLYIKVNDETNK